MTPTYTLTLADALTKLTWGTAEWRPANNAPINELHIHAARNFVTGAQIHISASEDFVLTTSTDNWLHPLGFTPRLRIEACCSDLPAGTIELLPIGYMEGDDRRWWMETLERSGRAECPAGRVQGVYVRIRVPRDIPAGSHPITLRALAQSGFGDEAAVWEGTLTLEVSPVSLPNPRDYAFHLNLWQHLTSLARYYRVPLWSANHFTIIERYYASLAELGQKAVSIVASEFPWSGQRCFRDPAYPSYLYEHSMIGVTRASDGSLRLDFAALDRLLELAARYGLDREIDVFGLLNIWVDEEYGFGKVVPDAPDSVRVRCWDETRQVFSYLSTAAELHTYIRELHDHFQRLGVLERVRVAADEPADVDAFNQSLAFIQQAGPGFQYTAAINHYEFLERTPPEVIDFTPVLPYAAQDPDLTKRMTAQLHQRGGRMTWYICCWPPIPNTFIHSPLPETRLIAWLTHALGLDGFLRWAFCLWPADPWQRVSYRAPDWSAGDMYFVLPGPDGSPVETLRFEVMREAMQDYELIQQVLHSLPNEKAQAMIDHALGLLLRAPAADFAGVGSAKAQELYSLDPADYLAARGILLDALASQLTAR